MLKSLKKTSLGVKKRFKLVLSIIGRIILEKMDFEENPPNGEEVKGLTLTFWPFLEKVTKMVKKSKRFGHFWTDFDMLKKSQKRHFSTCQKWSKNCQIKVSSFTFWPVLWLFSKSIFSRCICSMKLRTRWKRVWRVKEPFWDQIAKKLGLTPFTFCSFLERFSKSIFSRIIHPMNLRTSSKRFLRPKEAF